MHGRDFQSAVGSETMSTSIEVKKEIEGKLSEANANEKYLYSRVMELEKMNTKLEKRVNRLKRKKKELKQEVSKLREQIQSQAPEEVDEMTVQDEDQGVSKKDTEQHLEKFILNISSLRSYK